MVKKSAISLITALLVLSCIVAAGPGPAAAQSAGKLVKRGNDRFDDNEFEKAIEHYEKASVKAPESPIVSFNMGDAYYRLEDYEKAREYFEKAALETKDLSLEARAWYNMGNTAFREAQRQLDSDLEKALEYYRESVTYYETALERDPEFLDAAHNIEITRLVIKDLLDRIKKQQEEMQKQQEKLKEIVDSLLALAERERGAADESTALADPQAPRGTDWAARLGKLEGDQNGIAAGTRDARARLDTLFAMQRPPQIDSAQAHLDSSLVSQETALGDLAGRVPGAAAPRQEEALEQIMKAVEQLTEGENNQQQQGQQDQQQQDQQQDQQQQEPQHPEEQQQAARNETAKAILDEEKENKKKRRAQATSGYRPVEKDW
jgi:tetratricopeptide (TPR) repeat protein